jgi:hypothetical protein
MTANISVVSTRPRTRRFFVGMAIAIAVTVFAGFSRSYFLKAYYGTPELSLLLHVHGLVFTSWVLLFLAQTTLVAADRTDLHRRLGVGGAVLAALVLIVGTTTAILRVKGGSAPIPGVPPLAFLAVPLFDMVAVSSRQSGHPQAADDAGDDLADERADRPAADRGAEGRPTSVLRADRPLHRRDADLRSRYSQEDSPRHHLGRASDRSLTTAQADDLGDAGVDGVCGVAYPVMERRLLIDDPRVRGRRR